LTSSDTIDLGRRFEVTGELGRGAASRVLAVRDRLQDVDRAVKVATRRGQLRRFQAEFRRLCEFRHRNIVRAFDYGLAVGGHPFYTLELVDGVNLGAFEDRADPEPLGVLAMQLLDALATLHARGWVHRDLKPENILVVGRGTALLTRLIDLGLMARAGERSRSAGTLPYMAPEVARGEAIDGRADLYSLGIVLYEALLPEDMARTIEDVARRMTERMPPPSRVNPVIPSGLSEFVMKLIEPEPGDRFPDALTAATALAKVPGMRLSRGPPRAASERLLRGGATAHRPRLLRKLRTLAREARENSHGRMAVLEGNIGVGKTPLLRELSMTLSLDGFRVVRLRATHRPGSPVRALMRIARALGFQGVTPRASEASMLDPRARLSETSAFAGQIGVTLAAALGQEPTALLIDDLHRAEPVALEVLQSLREALEGVPLFVLCTGDRRLDGISLADTLGFDVRRLELLPLNRAEIGALVAHRLVGLKLPPPALERLARDSEGMPSLVERTLALLLLDGTVQKDGAGYVFAGGRYRSAHHQDRALAVERVEQVSEAHRSVLWGAAVLGRAISAAPVARLTSSSLQHTREALAELASLEILNPAEASREPGYAFVSRDVLSAVYQRIPQAIRRDLHERASDVVGGAGGSVEERAEHLLKSSNDDRAIDAAVAAGDRATLVHADRRAIEYYARAYARISGTEDTRAAPVALRLGRLFERTGELERASVWYQTAAGAATAEHGSLKAEATLGLGAVAYVRGLSSETERQAARALELLGARPDPRLQAMAHRLQALVATQGGDVAHAARLLEKTLAEVEAAGAEKEVVEVLLDLARYSRECGEHVKAVRYARRAQRRARRRGDASALADASTVLARGFLSAARFRAAKRALLHGLRGARSSGDRLREGLVLREIGNMRVREADFEGALARYQRSLELVRASRARGDESAALHNIGIVRSRLGEFRAALAALQAALDLTHSIGDVQGAAATATELGHSYARLGDLPRARSVLKSAIETAASLPDPVTAAEAGAILGWVEVRAGDVGVGHGLLGRLDNLIEPLEDPANAGLALLYATRCALLLGEPHKARRLADRLRAVVEAGGLGDLRPATIGVRGEAAALAGDNDRAIDLLTQAALAAARLELRPLEIDMRAALGRLLAGTDQSAAQLTRAMEVTREVVDGMPVDLSEVFLATAEAQRLRADFRVAFERMVGRPVGHTGQV